jgi:hypothetical protein
MRAYYEAELDAVRTSGGGGGGGGVGDGAGRGGQPRSMEAVAAAAAAAEAEDAAAAASGGRSRGGFTWDVNEAAAEHLRHDENGGGGGGGVRDSVWPDAWKGSYSPPREMMVGALHVGIKLTHNP